MKDIFSIKNMPLIIKWHYVNRLLLRWSGLLKWDFSSFQRVKGYYDYNDYHIQDGGFEIINFIDDESNKCLGIIVDNPNFKSYVMVIKGHGIFASLEKETGSQFCSIAPDFIEHWLLNWVIDNKVLLEDYIKNVALQDYRDRWGENFIKDLNVDERTLF